MSIFHREDRSPYDLSNITILLAEDSQYMQTLFAAMLKAFGVGEILACANAREATDLLTVTQARRTSRYVTDTDIILTDWLMPGGSGKELIQWVRGHESDDVRFLPIVVVSAYTTELVASQARDYGANEVLVKPVSGTSLASRICSVIDHPRPFIKAPRFFGPDRRRQDMEFRGEDRRKMKAKEIEVRHGR